MPDVIHLTHLRQRSLFPCTPFQFDGTVYKPSYFPSSDLSYEPGNLWQSMRFMDSLFGIRLQNLGTVYTPEILLSVYSSDALKDDVLDAVEGEIAWRYDLNSDLSGFYNEFAADPLLAPVLSRWCGVRPSTYTSLYEYLVISTLLQNATVRRTVQMSENLFSRFGSQLQFNERVLSAYWSPQAIQDTSEDELREIKLGYRAKILKRQSDVFGEGGVDEGELRKMPTQALKKKLLQIYGIGPASVGYLLFGHFKRYDAFEYISPWEQKIYSRLLFDQERVESGTILSEVDRRWGSWKMLAAHLLFEDLFWRRRNEPVPWLEDLIRL